MLVAFYITIIYFTVFFIVGTIIKNNSIVDIGWGLGFVVTTWILYFLYGSFNITTIIANTMVTLWGLRLFYHILKRNVFKEEDFRYLSWRKAWGKYVVIRAFIQVFMLQGILQFIIGSTVYYMNVHVVDFNIYSLIGVLIWIIGYYYQVIGDRQLKNHLKTSKKLLTKGLWSKTRHPNYFGESMMWIGIFVFGVINLLPIYFIISPLTITIVLYFISIPILEESMMKKDGYKEYCIDTPIFIPKLF